VHIVGFYYATMSDVIVSGMCGHRKVYNMLGYTMSDIPENNMKDCALYQPPV